jgi:hypothetical protein
MTLASSSLAVRLACILWPAFLMAGVTEALVFAVVDPADMRWFGEAHIDLSAPTIYSVSFLIFWGATALASALTQLMVSPEGARGIAAHL